MFHSEIGIKLKQRHATLVGLDAKRFISDTGSSQLTQHVCHVAHNYLMNENRLYT
jgi:hypothetical protein